MEIQVKKADITKLEVDCIVNAANSTLMGGGGVDGAIHRVGGPEILEQCKEIVKRIGSLPAGEAVITTGGNLPARFVIHTVGPIWKGGRQGEAELLHKAYWNSFRLAAENGCASIAFPNISTGAYGYPKEKALDIVKKCIDSARKSAEFAKIKLIVFAVFNEENLALYREIQG